MSNNDKFPQKTELAKAKNRPVNQDNFANYITQNSLPKAEGYLEALEDILAQIENSFTKQIGSDYFIATPNNIAKTTKLFYQKNMSFLEIAKNILKESAKENIKEKEKHECINENNFSDYIKLNGVDQAKGYLDALNDLGSEVDYGGYFCKLVNDKPVSKFSDAAVGRRMKNFSDKKKQFLKEAEILMSREMNQEESISTSLFQATPLSPLNSDTLPVFIKQRGMKVAKGYLEGVTDISIEIENTFTNKDTPQKENSLYMIGVLTKELFREKGQFHFSAEKLLAEHKPK